MSWPGMRGCDRNSLPLSVSRQASLAWWDPLVGRMLGPEWTTEGTAWARGCVKGNFLRIRPLGGPWREGAFENYSR